MLIVSLELTIGHIIAAANAATVELSLQTVLYTKPATSPHNIPLERTVIIVPGMSNARKRLAPPVAKTIESEEISYVFIKATEGTSLKDKHFKKHWRKAKEAGVRRGAYHFFRSSTDPEKQAKHFIKS